MVEMDLKLYLANACALIKKRLGDRMPFEMTVDDYENSSLERLIGAFRKFTANKELVKRLNKFKDERNFLSHRAISTCMDKYNGYWFFHRPGFQAWWKDRKFAFSLSFQEFLDSSTHSAITPQTRVVYEQRANR